MIKNVVFDLGNVIAQFDPLAIYDSFVNSKQEAQDLYQLMYENKLWWDLDRGVEIDVIIARMHSVAPSHYHHAITSIVHGWVDQLEIDEQMETLIRKLKSDSLSIYLLSNVSKQFYEFKKRNEIFTLFDGLYISAETTLVKPSKEIYMDFLNKFNCQANESIFIDDRLENIIGAQNVGFKVYHYQNDFNQLEAFLKETIYSSSDTR